MNPKKLSSEHTCHAYGCQRYVPPKLFMCREHWYALPLMLRDAIWSTYRTGQEISKTPSQAYLDAARKAQVWLARKEGHHKYADFREKLAAEEAAESAEGQDPSGYAPIGSATPPAPDKEPSD